MKNIFAASCFIASFYVCCAQPVNGYASYIKSHYRKMERMIAMRDGVKLFTAIYYPKDTTKKYPILIQRTPYSCAPYGPDAYPAQKQGPGVLFASAGYIFVYQDVRGRYMSEGSFQEMTPSIDHKKNNNEVDESSDTFDTIEWLLKHTSNNGKVGLYGISYPGFYATASLPGAHPAIKAVSPQAPVTDEFEGDDAYHRGAFYLMDNVSFLNFFDHPRPLPWATYPEVTDNLSINDAYGFYLKMGPLSNVNQLYFHDSSKIWNEYLQHATNDSYWQARNIRPHLTNIKPAVLVVGGWFDAEDMFGSLKTYEAIEKQNASNDCRLIMGPWTHGAWSAATWSRFAGYRFGGNTNDYFQQLQLAFFNYYLKGEGHFDQPEATIFFTGSNQWRKFDTWPPKQAQPHTWHLDDAHRLLLNDSSSSGADSYISDPANPVPYLDVKSPTRVDEYMAADQSFASKRADVLYYTSDVLQQDVTLSGPLNASLWVSTSGTDADFVVKVIDVLPDDIQTQQLVRAEVLRGKFRNSYTNPLPFEPNKITPLQLVLNDVAHTFLKGHRIMVQVQSSWFPLVDRNPQQFMDIPKAKQKDFNSSEIHLYHDAQHHSVINVMQLQ